MAPENPLQTAHGAHALVNIFGNSLEIKQSEDLVQRVFSFPVSPIRHGNALSPS